MDGLLHRYIWCDQDYKAGNNSMVDDLSRSFCTTWIVNVIMKVGVVSLLNGTVGRRMP